MSQHSQPSKGLVYGLHPVMEALQSGRPIEKIYLQQERNERIEKVIRLARQAQIPLKYVPEVRLQRLSKGAAHQGLIAILSPIEFAGLEETLLGLADAGHTALLIMLDGVTDVRNFGSIARSAECLGAQALIVPTQGAAAINAEAMKSSAGALNHLSVCREKNLVDSVLLLQAYGIKTMALTEKTSQSIYELDLTGPICLVMGSEEKGVSPSLLKRVDHLASIPMEGKIESLNVSVANGIVLAEVARQRSLA